MAKVLQETPKSEVPEEPQVSFRCKSCGFLEHSDHAAENDQPHSCRVCGAGIVLTSDQASTIKQLREKYGDPEYSPELRHPLPGITKIVDRLNWEHLDVETDDRLTELGLKRSQIVPHRKWERGEVRQPKLSNLTATDGSATSDGAP